MRFIVPIYFCKIDYQIKDRTYKDEQSLKGFTIEELSKMAYQNLIKKYSKKSFDKNLLQINNIKVLFQQGNGVLEN